MLEEYIRYTAAHDFTLTTHNDIVSNERMVTKKGPLGYTILFSQVGSR